MPKELRLKFILTTAFFIAILIVLPFISNSLSQLNARYLYVVLAGLLIFNYFEMISHYHFQQHSTPSNFKKLKTIILLTIAYYILVTVVFCTIAFVTHNATFDPWYTLFLMTLISFFQYRGMKKIAGEVEYWKS
ncbi:hypothetical protein [Macrococcus carouselicus]|uniref:Uncharacterized protein n=1 Tax=Macrococcus carouselicus TaxID=69969 RepID=A0A9Q8FKA1_9STAP|nr:hypothetical protein [Macrococcus carouselicus]TDL96638.1 hypothetical protein ERX40_09805 [Macrococcus carouselicus]